MFKTLVTGGTGFIGHRVVRRLLENGQAVRCLIRATSRMERLEGLSVERVVGDLRDADSLSRAAEGCNAIVHLGGISAWSEIASPDMFPVVVEGTKHLLSAAEEQGVARIVYVSSAAAMGPSRVAEPRDESAPFVERDIAGMVYVQAKREAERLCWEAAHRGLEVVVVRLAEVYGPDDRDFITAGNLVGLLKSSPVLVCAGGTSVIHVEDAAFGIIRALERGRSGETYLLGGDNVSHRELARLLLKLTKRRAFIVTVPGSLLRFGAAAATFCRLPFPIPPAVVPYATPYWYIDNRKAQRELGLQFRSAQQTLAETLAWLQSIGKLSVRRD